MRRHASGWLKAIATSAIVAISSASSSQPDTQRALALQDGEESAQHISPALFSSLERLSRLVDITYCVGTTGVSYPFSCISRCNEFPTLTLATTWNTGVMLSDSCGYIAVDHGTPRVEGGGESGSEGGEEAGNGEEAIVIAFRGTYSIANTVIDLSTVPQEYVPYPAPGDGDDGEPPKEPEHACRNCTVHMGFLASWRQARKLVLPELERLKALHPNYPVHLVGHSLGGAVAALAALEIKVSMGLRDVVVTTFGEPRVGNQGLVDYLDEVFGLGGGQGEGDDLDPEARTYRRVTHVNDPVPLLPPGEMGFRSHAGEFYISKSDLSPSLEDLRACRGDRDPDCIAGADDDYFGLISSLRNSGNPADIDIVDARTGVEAEVETELRRREVDSTALPGRLRLWQLFFAHRDYFWRLGLCVPGGDPANWGREKYPDNRNEL